MRVQRSRRVLAIVVSAVCVLGPLLASVWVLPAYAANPPRLGHLAPAAGHGTPSQKGIISKTSASISLSKNAYPPTSLLEVSGSGFGSNEDVDIYFDTTDLALAQSDASGSFSGIVIEVPASAVPGTHYVSVVGRSSGQQAQAPFLVSTNWNQFGFSPWHQGDNPYENVLSPSNVGQLQLAWTTTPIGYSATSPAIAGGNIYASGHGTSNEYPLYSFNQLTGRPTWRSNSIEPSGPTMAVNYLPINGTPSWVLFTSLDSDIGGVDAYNVSACTTVPCPLLWSQPLDAQAEVTYANGVVYASSADGHVYAFAADSGTPLWTSPAATGNYTGAPAWWGGRVYAGSYDGYLYAFNAADGAVLWKGSLGGVALTGTTVANGLVYINAGGTLEAFNALGCGAVTCAPVWTSTAADSYLSTDPAYANGVVYVGGGFNRGLYAFAAAGCGKPTCSPVWVGTTVDPVGSDISIANGVVYASSAYPSFQLEAFAAAGCGAATCDPLWTYAFSNGDFLDGSAPVISNGMLYVMSYYGKVYMFHLPATAIAPLPARPNLASLRPNLALRRAMPRMTPLPDLPDQ